MDEIERAIEARRRELLKSLAPVFAEDTATAVEMLIAALRHDLSSPLEVHDQQRFLAALERLPRGSTAAKGRAPMVTPLADQGFRIVFYTPFGTFNLSKILPTRQGAERYV